MTEVLDQPTQAPATEPQTIRKVSIVVSKGSAPKSTRRTH